MTDEAGKIAALQARIPGLPSPEGIGDDGALLAGRQVVTSDALVEDVHFFRDHPPAALGWKALAVNLSDVAAMGAVPTAFTLSVAVPPALPDATWHQIADGLGACANHYGVALIGGDTVASPGRMFISVTALGTLPSGQPPLTRSGAQPGDTVMVYGAVGRSAAGFAAWAAQTRTMVWPTSGELPPLGSALQAHLAPTPAVDQGPWAVAAGATAGLDLSDGLATDVPRLAAASSVAIAIDLDALPNDPACGGLSPRGRAAGGEDYSLLVTVPTTHQQGFEQRGFVRIGQVSAGVGVTWREHGHEVDPVTPSFRHFDAT